MVGTVPADLLQYFAHVMRIEQKLAYIYGWQSLLNEDDEVDDETVMKLVVLMGVMMQVGEATDTVTTEADKAIAEREQAIEGAKSAALSAAQTAGELAAEAAGTVGTVATEGLQAAGGAVGSALGAAGQFFGSVLSQAKEEKKALPQQSPKAIDSFENNLEKVKKLKELLDCGALTQDEFDAKKCELLGL